MDLLRVTERIPKATNASATLTLPFELRQKSRLRATLDDGQQVALLLSRGHVLRSGDCLQAENGIVIEVKAADEEVSTGYSVDENTLARACYHLGNRHVPLQVGSGWCRYLQDHVLDQMIEAMHLQVKHELAPFEPESGAYQHGHNHSHEHQHAHTHDAE